MDGLRDTYLFLCALVLLLLAFSVYTPPYSGFATKQCVDGDGKDYYYQGTTSVTGGHDVEDTCDSSGKILQEFFCNNGKLDFTFFTCSGSCVNGACSIPSSQEEPLDGESLSFGTNSDRVEINEFLGEVQQAFTEDDIGWLKSGTISTQQGATGFNQYLRFGDDFDTGKVVFDENDENDVGDFLFFDHGDFLFEYEIQFEDGLRSEVDGTSLSDLDDQHLIFFGQEYEVASARKNKQAITLRLVGGTFSELLYEGDTKTFVVNGKPHLVEVFTIDDTQHEVILTVDGKMLNELEEGEFTSVGGITLAIGDIYVQESADGKDFVRLFVDARTVELKDDASDTSFTSGVKVNGQSFSEGLVKIQGQGNDDEYTISDISYRVVPESETGGDIYVGEGDSLLDVLDEPSVLLGSIDIVYKGLESDGVSEVTFDPHGSGYDLTFTNIQGNVYTVGLVKNANGLVIGDDDTLHFLEAASSSTFIVDTGDYLVLSEDNDHTGVTHIVRYQSIDTTGKNLQFDDDAEGSKTVTYTGTEGSDSSGELVLSGHQYRVFVGGAPDYNLAVDLNGDGDVDGAETKIIVQGGGILDLGSSQTPGSSFEMTLTTEASQFDENSNDEVITIDIIASGSEIDIGLDSQSSLSIKSDDNKIKAMSTYGVYLEKNNGNPDRLVVEYPLSQQLADVRVVFTPSLMSDLPKGELCGNNVCDSDEGYQNCPLDCEIIQLDEETTSPAVTTTCGNGVCDEMPSTCIQDCVKQEKPTPIVVEEKKGFWAQLWGWIVALF